MEDQTEPGQWRLVFTMAIEGADALGDPNKYKRKITINLFATKEEEAIVQADYNIENIKKMGHAELKKNYCSTIDNEDEITFSDWKIVYKKELKVEIPKVW